MKITEFFDLAWTDYSRMTPDAPFIQELLLQRGEKIVNDHVAFRTFEGAKIGRLELGKLFVEHGYVPQEDLDFTEKKLKATYYLHRDPSMPKIFISELLTTHFSKELQEWVGDLVRQATQNIKTLSLQTLLEPNWQPVRFADYQKFYSESEYASWTAAFGIRVNHFTVLVNNLKSFKSLQELNDFLVSHEVQLNQSGGVIKGTPEQLLEQSSTMAKKVPCAFAEGTQTIMGCYYEFARRYSQKNGTLFQGFIPKSADKIFESTFEKR